jgi:hypothetical protein
MDSLLLYFGIGVTALIATAILALTALRAFTGWLDLKRAEIDRASGGHDARVPSAVARIDIADLKERIRKLEAIAAGVDI